MSKNSENKKGVRVGFKGIIIAMILALLGFLGWDGLDLGNGSGSDEDTGTSQNVSDENDQTNEDVSEDTTNTSPSVGDNTVNSKNYNIYVVEDKIFIDGAKGLEEISTTQLEIELKRITDKGIILYDDGAVKKVYDEVEAMIDVLKLPKTEEKKTN